MRAAGVYPATHASTSRTSSRPADIPDQDGARDGRRSSPGGSRRRRGSTSRSVPWARSRAAVLDIAGNRARRGAACARWPNSVAPGRVRFHRPRRQGRGAAADARRSGRGGAVALVREPADGGPRGARAGDAGRRQRPRRHAGAHRARRDGRPRAGRTIPRRSLPRCVPTFSDPALAFAMRERARATIVAEFSPRAASRPDRGDVRRRRSGRCSLARHEAGAHRLHRPARRSRHDRRHRAPCRGDRVASGRRAGTRSPSTRGPTTPRAGSPSTAGCACATSPPRRPSTSRPSCTAVSPLPSRCSRARDRADILHYHAIGPSVFTPLPRALTRRGVVLTIHGLDYDRDKWGIGARAALKQRRMDQRPRAARHHHGVEEPRGLLPRRYGRVAHYIPNGVASPVQRAADAHHASASVSQGGDYALFLGRLVPEKAPDLLHAGFRHVDTTSRLVIAGGSSFTDTVRRTSSKCWRRAIRASSWSDRCTASCSTSCTPMRRCSCCRLEPGGAPLTLLEAASYRLPLVASDIPPNREIIGSRRSRRAAVRERRREAASLRR